MRLACSLRNGMVVIELGGSKSQCGQSEANKQLRLGLHGIEGRLQQLQVAPLQRLAGEVHLADVLARRPLQHRRLAHPHHELVVEPLHDERHPGEPALDPHQLELREALGQPVDHPVGQVDEAVVHERQGVHGDEAVELQERRVAPVEARVEGQRLARLLDHRIELHVLIVVHGPVAGAGDREADDALGVAEVPDDALARLGRVEGQVEQALDALVLRQDALDQPAVVGAADGGLDVLLRVHAEHQHRGGEHHLVVEAHGVHGAARQLGEMVALAAVDGLGQRHLMGNAAVDVLEGHARLGIEQRRIGGAGPHRHRLAHLADHVVVDEIDDLGPELGLGDVRVDVDEEIVLHPLGLDGGVREDVARVGLDGDLLELSDLPYRSLLHRRSPPSRAARPC